jgi:regulator of PEP synthase PpsR (kinase-PPPase family)
MQRLKARIAKELAKFRERNEEPDYEEQARIIVLIVNEERLAEIREWRERRMQGRVKR